MKIILAVLVVAPALGIVLDRVLFRHLRTASAVANAVANALGVRVNSLPITPARVLAALAGKSTAAPAA
jgi:hypothetical protein